VFDSAVYPYRLELPAGIGLRRWRAAVVAWDGAARIGTDTRNVDLTGTIDGTLMVFGMPWTGTLAQFRAVTADVTARFHGCSVISEPQPFEIGGVAAIGAREACAQKTPAGGLVLVKDGYGMAFRLMINVGKEAVALPDLASWLETGLTWRQP
jgi:hypothetical protein